jgi:TatD DNase family protein
MFIDIHSHQATQKFHTVINADLIPTDNWCSYGVHPWYVEQTTATTLQTLEQLIQQPNCVAVGECGLDKISNTAWDKQMFWFEQQIQLSEKHQKPLIIHCVKAIQEIIVLKREYQPQQPWIFHGFRKTTTLQQVLNEGFYISIGAAVLADEKLQSIVPVIPINRLFLETDDQPISIVSIYEKVAQIRAVSVEELEQQMLENYHRVFEKSKI